MSSLSDFLLSRLSFLEEEDDFEEDDFLSFFDDDSLASSTTSAFPELIIGFPRVVASRVLSVLMILSSFLLLLMAASDVVDVVFVDAITFSFLIRAFFGISASSSTI